MFIYYNQSTSSNASSEISNVSDEARLVNQIKEYKRALNYLSVNDDPRLSKEFQSMCENERLKMSELLNKLNNGDFSDKSINEIRGILADSSGKVIEHPVMENEIGKEEKTVVIY
jgi:hypothetical protein